MIKNNAGLKPLPVSFQTLMPIKNMNFSLNAETAEVFNHLFALYGTIDSKGKVLTLAGGFPIVQNGAIVGGLGISGGDFVQDKTIGEKALTAIL